MAVDRRLLVFTDLDATLLDHDTYRWDPALPALEALENAGSPVVLNSSKTLSEMVVLSAEICPGMPLICENGALVAIPVSSPLKPPVEAAEIIDGYAISYLGTSRQTTLGHLQRLRAAQPEFQFEGYADWTVAQVAEYTQLPLEGARLSKQRLGTEPIHWHGTESAYQEFQQQLAALDLRAVAGGRFIHISGRFDKGRGLEWLKAVYQAQTPQVEWVSVALGDSPNDIPMLNAADIAVAIPNHTRLTPTAPRVIHAREAGPTGWNLEILSLLNEL